MRRFGFGCMWIGGLLLLGGAKECETERLFRCDAPQDGSWLQYGRDTGNTHCVKQAEFRDAENVHKLKKAWAAEVPAGSTNTPLAKDGVVYFGDWNGTLHAVHEKTGKPLWATKVIEGAPIRATPTIAGDKLYLAIASLVAALDLKTGELRWLQLVDEQETAYLESSPIFVDGKIIVGVASFELTLDLEDYTFRGSVVALDAETGNEVWRLYTAENTPTSGAGVSVWSSATVDHARKLLYIGTGQGYEAPASPLSDSLLAINYQTGKLVWQNQFTRDDVYTVPKRGPGEDFDVGATPTLFRAGERDLVGVGSKAGIFKAMDRDTGETVWAVQLNSGSDVGGIMASAAAAHGVLFVNSNNWVEFGFFTGMQSPKDTSSTFALRADTGEILWKRDLPAPMFGAVTVANGVVYQGLIDGSLIALDAKDGEELWRDQLPGPVGAGVSVAGSSLYVSYGFEFFKAEDSKPPPAGVRAYR